MSNILLDGKNALQLSPTEENAQKLELLSKNETSLYDLQMRKANIEQRRQDLAIDSKEKNLDAVEEINRNINDLLRLASDPELAMRLSGGIETGKDYNEFVKAITSIAKMRDDLLERTFDASANTGKKKKIAVAFQGQGVSVMVGVETNE